MKIETFKIVLALRRGKKDTRRSSKKSFFLSLLLFISFLVKCLFLTILFFLTIFFLRCLLSFFSLIRTKAVRFLFISVIKLPLTSDPAFHDLPAAEPVFPRESLFILWVQRANGLKLFIDSKLSFFFSV